MGGSGISKVNSWRLLGKRVEREKKKGGKLTNLFCFFLQTSMLVPALGTKYPHFKTIELFYSIIID